MLQLTASQLNTAAALARSLRHYRNALLNAGDERHKLEETDEYCIIPAEVICAAIQTRIDSAVRDLAAMDVEVVEPTPRTTGMVNRIALGLPALPS